MRAIPPRLVRAAGYGKQAGGCFVRLTITLCAVLDAHHLAWQLHDTNFLKVEFICIFSRILQIKFSLA